MKERHDVPLIGHVGVHQTVDHIKQAFWWKGLWGDIGQYTRSYPVCQLMKSDHRKKPGILQPIHLPKWKWQRITTGLVTYLLEPEGITMACRLLYSGNTTFSVVFWERLVNALRTYRTCTKHDR